MRVAELIGMVVITAWLSSAGVLAQVRDQHSDVEFNPTPLEVFRGRRSCFPVYESRLRVNVSVYESVPGTELGAAPTRHAMPDVARALEARVAEAYPGWTFTARAQVWIEVMVVREASGSGGGWTVVTTWAGLGGAKPLESRCVAGIRSERVQDLEVALDHIVRLMVTGQEIPRASP